MANPTENYRGSQFIDILDHNCIKFTSQRVNIELEVDATDGHVDATINFYAYILYGIY